jgi:sulfatase modifying factor 1
MKRREKTQLIWILLGLLTVTAASLAGRNYLSAGKVVSIRDPADHTNNSRLHNATGGHEGALEDAGEPPVIVGSRPPGPDPDGMIWIPAGEFSMGTQEPMFTDTRPIHRVALNGFWMDRTEVTNEQFSAFVRATGYVTVAERKPRAEDYPGVPPEKLVAGSIVFSPPKDAVPLNDYMQWWSYVGGADWRHPEGPKSDLEGREKHPVVHIAWEDANVFAKWAGKRLPTEAEFEWAARGGLDRKKYVWGDDFKPSGKFQANTFQGNFPNNNTGADGYLATAPVGSFEPNGFGLSDVAGNVWEWCSDWYRADYYQTVSSKGSVTRDPAGPADSSDPNEPGVPKRVTKGGSFLCTDQYCSRYMPGGRGKEAPDSGTNHLGFRLVKDLK